jgi:hypothetical protein
MASTLTTSPATAQGTAFTYQGHLRRDGNAVSNTCDFQFRLFDAPAAGNQIGAQEVAENVSVVDGLFSVLLDFGGLAFDSGRWLEIAVRCPAQGPFALLSPRQTITNVPLALAAPARDDDGNIQANIGVTNEGAGFLRTVGPNGNRNVLVSTFTGAPNGGLVGVYNEDGNERGLFATSNTTDNGFLTLRGPNGNLNLLLGSLSGAADNGFLGVYDADGTIQAGVFVNAQGQGEVFGDVKNFAVDHPRRPGTKLVYASLEGPEVAIYHRGSVRLERGRGAIELPEHFVALANADSITVQLTPRSFDSKGVGFGELQGNSIEIRELDGGRGSYDVHYVVHAVRRGYEDRSPVVSAEQFRRRYGASSTEMPPLAEEDDAGYALETFARIAPPAKE